MPITDTGIIELERDLAAEVGAADLVLELRNTAEYAQILQDLEGYFVIDEEHFYQTAVGHVEELVRSGLPLTEANLRLALDAAGKAEVNYLRSLTGATTEDGRERHPGHWADDSTLLSQSYESEVL